MIPCPPLERNIFLITLGVRDRQIADLLAEQGRHRNEQRIL